MEPIVISDKDRAGKLLTYDNYLSKLRRSKESKLDNRYVASHFNRFQRLNHEALTFLDIDVHLSGENDDSIILTPGPYVGMAPIRSVSDGMLFGTISVKSQYQDKLNEILPLLGKTFTPEFEPSMQLGQEAQIDAPILMECLNYMRLFKESLKKPWQRFSVEEMAEKRPNGGTDWVRYVQESYNPEMALVFHNRNNLLTTDHTEWRKLTYVLQLCLDQLHKYALQHNCSGILDLSTLNMLERYVQIQPQMAVIEFSPRKSDPIHIQVLKEKANLILKCKTNLRCAWRVNFAEFFERYCQHICTVAARMSGAVIETNPKINIGGYRPSWTLRYLEPDIVLRRGTETFVLDAKYKNHLLYTNVKNTDEIKEEFRRDLHQIMAYTGLYGGANLRAAIIYPCNELQKDDPIAMTIERPGCGGNARVWLLGTPIEKDIIPETAKIIANLFSDIME